MENKEDIKLLTFKALHALNAIKNLLDGFAENIEVTVKQDGKEIKIDPLPAIENAMKSFAILAIENIKLKQQLAAKDKALDKACGKLEYEYTHSDRGRCPNVDYGFIPKYCNKDFCNDSNKECRKEWTEKDEID